MNGKEFFRSLKLKRLKKQKENKEQNKEPSGHYVDESIIFNLPIEKNTPNKFILKPDTPGNSIQEKMKISEEDSERHPINEVYKPRTILRVKMDSGGLRKNKKLSKKVTACKTISEEEKAEERANAFGGLFGFGRMKAKKELGKESKLFKLDKGEIDVDIAGMVKKNIDTAKNLLGRIFKEVK